MLNDSIVVDMNNPTCGDRIRLTMKIEDEKVIDAKFEGEGCSISMASASMMTQAIKGKDIETALKMSQIFSDMMLGKEYDDSIDLGDIEALQEWQNSQRASNVQHYPGRRLKRRICRR